MQPPVAACRHDLCCGQRSYQAGFTLLELLVAMVIIAMIMTTAFGAVRAGNRSWQAGRERTAVIEEMQAVSEFLRRQLGQTVPVAWHDDADTRLAFAGGPRKLRFIAPAPHSTAGAGLLVYTLVIDNDRNNDTSQLRLSLRPYDPGASDFGNSGSDVEMILATNSGDASLDFFGATTPASRPSWHSEWPAAAKLYPKLVRLRSEAGDGISGWPELVLPIRVSVMP